MKKVIFGILSILLISPVFAENINGISYENSITLENLTESDNITYLQIPNIFGSAWYAKSSYLGYYGNNAFGFFRQSAISTFTGYGRDITLSNSMFIQSGDSLISGSDSLFGYGILAVQKSGVLYDFSKFQLFISRDSEGYYSGFNPLFSFSFNYIDGIYDILNQSYVRVFFTGGDLFSSVPVGYQVFQKGSNTFKTNKYNFSTPDGSNYTFVAPNISYGFSYINTTPTSGYSWSNFQLNTVFPYYDYFGDNSSIRNIPNWAYTNKFYIFRYNGLDQDSDMFHIGVLSKCNDTFCSGSGLYSNLLYSEYVCSFPSFDPSDNSINLSDSCTLYGGGVVKNILPFQDSTGFASNNFLKFINGWISDQQRGTYNIGLSSNFYINSSDQLCIRLFDYWNYRFSSYSRFCYDIEYGAVIPDILHGFDNTDVPPEPLTPGTVENLLDIYCNQLHLINPAICNKGGAIIGSGAYTYEPIVSGDQVILVVTDYSDTNDYIIHTGEDGEIWLECVGDWCPIYDNTGSSEIGDLGGSGFILSTGYYENFFNQTGYLGKCPYPYTDLQFGEKVKIFNKISEALGGFDIFLPINCSIAAFTAGKTYNFLSDVNLGSNPLMGQIQDSDDPRVYLYRFFDFLFSFALIVFLLKFYHLLN